MIKVFGKEEFVEEVFEMEAEYLEQFGSNHICEYREGTELDIWFKDFNINEQIENFILNKKDPF